MEWLRFALIVSQILASAALMWRRTHFPILAYLLVSLARTLYLSPFSSSDPEYRHHFFASLPLLMVAQFGAVSLTMSDTLRSMPRYGTASRWLFGPLALVLATAAAVALPAPFGALGIAQTLLSIILGVVSIVAWVWFRLLGHEHSGHVFLALHFGTVAIANVLLFAGIRPANWLIPMTSIVANLALVLMPVAGIRYAPVDGAVPDLRSSAKRAWLGIKDLISR